MNESKQGTNLMEQNKEVDVREQVCRIRNEAQQCNSSASYAKLTLGCLHLLGRKLPDGEVIVERDLDTALKLFNESNTAGSHYLLSHLCTEYSAYFARSQREALSCFYSDATEHGMAAAMNKLGNVCMHAGIPDEAFNWYRDAAQLGNPAAFYNLGILYLTGRNSAVGFDFKADKKFSLEYLTKSADLGFPAAMYMLGIIHESEADVKAAEYPVKEETDEESFGEDDTYGEYSDTDDIGAESSEEETDEITVEEDGNDDYSIAWKYYFRAGWLGHAPSQCHVGTLYRLGRGTNAINYVRAVWWYKQALRRINFEIKNPMFFDDQGCFDWPSVKECYRLKTEALYSLGEIFREGGHGIDSNPNLAVQFYREAANDWFNDTGKEAVKRLNEMHVPLHE